MNGLIDRLIRIDGPKGELCSREFLCSEGHDREHFESEKAKTEPLARCAVFCRAKAEACDV